jgi:hypothetical protein
MARKSAARAPSPTAASLLAHKSPTLRIADKL